MLKSNDKNVGSNVHTKKLIPLNKFINEKLFVYIGCIPGGKHFAEMVDL